jgi:glutamate-ammonia-ligase adenylyltransferase
MLRFTIADIEGELPVMALSDELSALADLILEATLAEAAASLGLPRGGVPGFGVVGYGKLGGKELGYGSDLDIVFVYDEARADDSERFARVAQRVSTWLTTLTPAGVLYEVDLRLRPDGAKGLFVTSLPAFREYQLHRAWTWEHQALTRTRFSAGDPALGARFEKLRDEILATARDRAKLLAEIVSMRQRMRDENRGSKELKHVPGGIIDLEFAVQAIVLVHGTAHPKLRLDKGNHQILRWAGELGILDPAVANAAADAYLALRRRTHEAALNDEDKVIVGDGDLVPERAAVRALWAGVFDTTSPLRAN